jgi:hypothetical protein
MHSNFYSAIKTQMVLINTLLLKKLSMTSTKEDMEWITGPLLLHLLNSPKKIQGLTLMK